MTSIKLTETILKNKMTKPKNNAIVIQENDKNIPAQSQQMQTGSPDSLLQLAITNNIDIEKLEKLLLMKERWDASQNRKLFFEALSKFQSEIQIISKDKKADFPSSKGGRVQYSYSSLANIIKQIQQPLYVSGLSYRWEVADDGPKITVTCIITHVGGHFEKTTMNAANDNSGSKNDIQAHGSAISYLQRYTLVGALGLGTAQDDPDGEKKRPAAPVQEAGQANDIHPDMQMIIDECQKVAELTAVWNQNQKLHSFEPFIKAIKERRSQITTVRP